VRTGAPWLALAVTGLFAASAGAHAASFPTLALARCACNAGQLDALRAEIESAPDAEEARRLAAPPLRLAREAVARAQQLPGGSALAATERRLVAGERAVAAAPTAPAVASAFSAAVGPPAAAGCSYTTLEIVAIVLGFILGIIPGLILLVLLC
jgi:hypothetical protein